ncbi:MAG: hypothetical protein BGO21_07360 [Dyadobacter sp. 50-39]|uniref:hypothetical protein n=1 Tax=Dyadobacter sp. 50-39 TaxID=1895756 RepID=UPI00095ACFD6|nr:hypothetical protein [Dyadobacter sp. 50-39]OJV17191.1 MAG: hypothetical protein BGO21_07360 [Dyadobacter sp. 50-39]
MKAFVITAALSAALALSNVIQAQPGLPGGPDRMAARGPGRPPMPIGQPAPGGLRPVNAWQGKVVRWQYNDDSVFDGFYVLSGSDSVLITFPPHLGKQIAGSAKVGRNVNLTGTAESTPFGATEVRLVSINNATINDSPRQEMPPVEKFVEQKGKISSLRKGRDGMVNGVLLDNKTLLKLPPHIIMQLGDALQPGSTIGYSGNQRNADGGEISQDNLNIVHANTLTVNGQQHLLR